MIRSFSSLDREIDASSVAPSPACHLRSPLSSSLSSSARGCDPQLVLCRLVRDTPDRTPDREHTVNIEICRATRTTNCERKTARRSGEHCVTLLCMHLTGQRPSRCSVLWVDVSTHSSERQRPVPAAIFTNQLGRVRTRLLYVVQRNSACPRSASNRTPARGCTCSYIAHIDIDQH